MDFDIAGLHDSMAKLTASLGLNESARHHFVDVARDQRATAAKDEDLKSRRARNEATSQQERALTAEHKQLVLDMEDARGELEDLAERREAHGREEPKAQKGRQGSPQSFEGGVDLGGAF